MKHASNIFSVMATSSVGAAINNPMEAATEEAFAHSGSPGIQSPSKISKGPLIFFGVSTCALRKGTKTFSENVQDYATANHWETSFVNAGVPGNTTVMAKRRFQRDILDHSPSYVIIDFGINDSMVDTWKNPPATGPRVALDVYLENLQYFIREIRSHGGQAILVTPQRLCWTPKLRELYGTAPYDPNDPDGLNSILDDYAAAMRKLSAKEKIPLVDIHQAWMKFPDETGVSASELLHDGMHPNDRGHQVISNLLIEKLLNLHEKKDAGGLFRAL